MSGVGCVAQGQSPAPRQPGRVEQCKGGSERLVGNLASDLGKLGAAGGFNIRSPWLHLFLRWLLIVAQ